MIIQHCEVLYHMIWLFKIMWSHIFVSAQQIYCYDPGKFVCVCSFSQSVFATYDFFSQSAEVGCDVQRIMGAIILCSTFVEARAGDRKYILNIQLITHILYYDIHAFQAFSSIV